MEHHVLVDEKELDVTDKLRAVGQELAFDGLKPSWRILGIEPTLDNGVPRGDPRVARQVDPRRLGARLAISAWAPRR